MRARIAGLLRAVMRTFAPKPASAYRPVRAPDDLPGDFYCDPSICLGCRVMDHEAPELVGWNETTRRCYVKRQPVGAQELRDMLRAASCSEVDGLRYAGSDPEVRASFARLGIGRCCDVRPDAATDTRLRTRAVVRLHAADVASARSLLRRLRERAPRHVSGWSEVIDEPDGGNIEWTGLSRARQVVRARVADGALVLTFSAEPPGGIPVLAVAIHDALRQDRCVDSIRWYASGETGTGADYPA
jgi:hypothetical protein